MRTHRNAIAKIADGDDMWLPTASFLLTRFRHNYLSSYAAFPSNSHLAESNVKDANFCSVIGRSDATALLFSTARSGLVEHLNTMAQHEVKNHKKESKGINMSPVGLMEAGNGRATEVPMKKRIQNRGQREM